jgi:hypothetical protein
VDPQIFLSVSDPRIRNPEIRIRIRETNYGLGIFVAIEKYAVKYFNILNFFLKSFGSLINNLDLDPFLVSIR